MLRITRYRSYMGKERAEGRDKKETLVAFLDRSRFHLFLSGPVGSEITRGPIIDPTD